MISFASAPTTNPMIKVQMIDMTFPSLYGLKLRPPPIEGRGSKMTVSWIAGAFTR
jgi:hypothetical protein